MFNACHSASAIAQTADTIRLGTYDIGIAVGMDKHPRGAFTDNPRTGSAAVVCGERGSSHHQVLRDEGQPLHPRPRHLAAHPGRVAVKNFRNGEKNPNAFRRTPIGEDDILASQLVNYPLTQYMFCSPDEGRLR